MTYPPLELTLSLVKAFDPAGNDRAARSKLATHTLLERNAAPFDRKTFDPGHITASAVVVAAERQAVLLVYHKKLARWLQPGGHAERADPDIQTTAMREVLEETGVAFQDASDWPLVGIDVHEIPGTETEPNHRHHDLCFSVEASRCQVAAVEPVAGATWCPIADLDRYGVDQALRTCLTRALHVTL